MSLFTDTNVLMARNKKEPLAVWNTGDSGAQGAQSQPGHTWEGKVVKLVKLQVWARESGELCLGLAEKRPLLSEIVPAVGQGSWLSHRGQ